MGLHLAASRWATGGRSSVLRERLVVRHSLGDDQVGPIDCIRERRRYPVEGNSDLAPAPGRGQALRDPVEPERMRVLEGRIVQDGAVAHRDRHPGPAVDQVPDQEAVEDDLAAVVRDVDHAADVLFDLVAVVDRETAIELVVEEGGKIGGDLVPLHSVVEGVPDDRGGHEVAKGREARAHGPARSQDGPGARRLDSGVGIAHPELTDGNAVELARDHGLRHGTVAQSASRAAQVAATRGASSSRPASTQLCTTREMRQSKHSSETGIAIPSARRTEKGDGATAI